MPEQLRSRLIDVVVRPILLRAWQRIVPVAVHMSYSTRLMLRSGIIDGKYQQ